jgi:hypothetical protein
MLKHSRLSVKLANQNANHLQNLESRPPQLLMGDCAENPWASEFSLLDLSIVELVCQFTVWSSTRHFAIRRSELLDCAWGESRPRYRAPNVIALTQHYN